MSDKKELDLCVICKRDKDKHDIEHPYIKIKSHKFVSLKTMKPDNRNKILAMLKFKKAKK